MNPRREIVQVNLETRIFRVKIQVILEEEHNRILVIMMAFIVRIQVILEGIFTRSSRSKRGSISSRRNRL